MSMRFHVAMLIMLLGILPCLVIVNLFIYNIKQRSLSSEEIAISSQAQLLSNQIVTSGYLQDPSVNSVNTQLNTLGNIYSGRIMVIDSNMKAEVKNILGGTSEMTSLADDSLSIRMSPALKIDMFLLHSQAVTGDSSLVVCMVQTFGIDSLSLESTVDYYTLSWQHMITPPQLSPSDKQRIERVKVQTILNWRRKILKNN